MKTNYQKMLLELVNNLKTTPRLLLHSCCGPCSTTCISFLTNYFDITVLYYNPNIEPRAEYEKRKAEQIKFLQNFSGKHEITFLDSDYENDLYHEAIKGLEAEKEGGARCTKCFYFRLHKCAELALAQGYDYFGTTLTVSPHKNSQVINTVGAQISEELGIPFLYSDFKKNAGYQKSILLSKEYDLYRQNYCGCLYSKTRP